MILAKIVYHPFVTFSKNTLNLFFILIKYEIKSAVKLFLNHHQLLFMKNILPVLIGLLVFTSCSEKNKYDVSTDKTYEKSKATLEDTEKKNPESFLHVQGDEKKNLIGQTVVKGKIINNAKVVTFKDVNIKLSFY